MNIVFILVLLVLVFCGINGWRKGMLGIVYSLISWIFILLFVIWANPHVEQYLRERTSLPETMQQKMEAYLTEKTEEIAQEQNASGAEALDLWLQELPEPMREVMENVRQNGADVDAPGDVAGTEVGTAGAVTESIKSAMMVACLDYVMRGIAILIAFIIAQLIVWIVGNMINTVAEAPVIRGVNGMLGLLTGLLKGLLYVWIFMYMVALTATVPFSAGIVTDIYENTFLTYLYQHNIILAVMEMFL